MNTICIMCPLGCNLTINEVDNKVVVEGNTCKRGEMYGRAEYTHPERTVTTLVNMRNGEVASVKTSKPVPKERVFDVLDFVAKLVIDDDVEIGQTVAIDVLGLGSDLIVTGRK